MISFNKIWVFSATILGFTIIFSEAIIIISRNLEKKELYRMDMEITEHIDRFYNVFRKAELWNVYEDTVIRSKFKYFMETDDNVKELIHYMEFIRTSGAFLDSLTLSYSILYTKHKAAFYAINILNIYEMKKVEFESLDDVNPMNEVLKNHKITIFQAYLKIAQYLAWYSLIGNEFLLDEIKNKLSKKVPCAEESFENFRESFKNILSKLDKEIFQKTNTDVEKKPDSPIDLDTFWSEIIFKKYTKDIQTINRYFATIFSGSEEDVIDEKDFLQTFKKEISIAKFVSDLSVMKGRDIEETFSNFDIEYENKKELYESNITNMMMVIENEEMKSLQDASPTEQIKTRKNEKYLILQPMKEDELFTCLRFELTDHEVIWKKEDLESQSDADVPADLDADVPADLESQSDTDVPKETSA